MTKTICTILATVTIPASAAVPLKWTVETSRVQPAQFDAYHGETLDMKATFLSYGSPLALPADADCRIFWQTNGMGNVYWSTNAVLVSSNAIAAVFRPTFDPGATTVLGFLGIPASNYRAAFTIRFRGSPGATPFNPPPMPQAEYYTKPEVDSRIEAAVTVKSVNGKTGNVVLGASDVGAFAAGSPIRYQQTQGGVTKIGALDVGWLSFIEQSGSGATATAYGNGKIQVGSSDFLTLPPKTDTLATLGDLPNLDNALVYDPDGISGQKVSTKDGTHDLTAEDIGALGIYGGTLPSGSLTFKNGGVSFSKTTGYLTTQTEFKEDAIRRKVNNTTTSTISYPSQSGTIALLSDIPSAPGDYATVSNRAMNAVQPAAISDMETRTHAAANYAAKSSLQDKFDKSGGNMSGTLNLVDGSSLLFDGEDWTSVFDRIVSQYVWDWSSIYNTPTTLSGYGIEDAYIQNGTITLGSQSITPLTSYIETDPTVDSKISTHNSSASAHSDIRTALAGKQETISDLAAIRSGAAAGATAVQPAAISDMETRTHAAQTYQPAGQYLTSESDPTVSSWAKATSKPSYTWSEVGSKPSWIGDTKPAYSWSEIGSKPTTFAPASHVHAMSDVTGLAAALDAKRGMKDLSYNTSVFAAWSRNNYSIPIWIDGAWRLRQVNTVSLPKGDADSVRLEFSAADWAGGFDFVATRDFVGGEWTTSPDIRGDNEYAIAWHESSWYVSLTTDSMSDVPKGDSESTIISWTDEESPFVGAVTFTRTVETLTDSIALESDIPTALKCPNSLTINVNGTLAATYDGSAAKTVNIPTAPEDIGAAPASIANTVNAWQTYWDGDDVRVTVTNYYGSQDLPSLYLEQKISEGGTNYFKTIWTEKARLDAINNRLDSLEDDVESKADRAWGFYDSHSGTWAPDGFTSVSSGSILISKNMSYQKNITSGGEVWVLTSNDPTLISGTETNGFFKISDSDGNSIVEVVKGDKRAVPATWSAVSYGGNSLTINFNVVSADHPSIEICSDLIEADWKSEDEASCPATVVWSGSSGNYVATVTGKAAMPKMFVKGTYEAGGETYIKNSAPLGFEKVVIGGVYYRVSVETVNGKKLMVLTEL